MSRLALGRMGLKLVAVGMFAVGLPITGLTVTATVAQAASSTTSTPKLSVVSALNSLAGGAGAPKGGDAVTKYKWILQEDPTVDGHSTPYSYPQTNNPESLPLGQQPSAANPDLCHPIIPAGYPSPYPHGNPSYPQGCNWPSVNTAHNAPIVTQGDNSDWSLSQIISGVGPTDVAGRVCGTTGYDPTDCAAAGWTPADGIPNRVSKPLPPGNYIISVMADGYEIGGTRFQIPFVSTDDTLKVKLNPGPLPLGTLQILAFDDMAPTGGAYAAETESGLAGFKPQLTDFTDQVTQDYYGYPLCTTYKTDPAGKVILDQYGRPTPDQLGGPDGQCVTGSDGIVKIPNLASGRYGVSLVPTDDSWKQTTTLEGAHDFDVWLQANDSGLDTELVLAGEPVPFVQFGYAKMGDCSDPVALATDANGNGLPVPYVFAQGDFQPGECLPGTAPFLSPTHSGEITGRLMAEEPYVPGIGGLAGQAAANGQAGLRVDRPISDGLIALADMNDGDRTKLVIKANTDGTYDIKGVPDGTYNMSIWDYNQDYAFDAFQVEVHGKVVTRNFTAGAARTVAAGTVRNGANGLITAAAPNKLTALARPLPAISSTSSTCTLFFFFCLTSTGTLNFVSNPALNAGDAITLAGFSPGAWNGTKTITATAGNSATFGQFGALPASTAIGTATQPALTFSAADIARTISSSTAAIPAGTRVTAFNAARSGGAWTHSGTSFTRTSGITFVATDIGSVITGTGIPAGTYVVSVTNPNTVVLSQAPSAASGTSFSLNASITLSQNGSAASGFAFQLGSGAQTVAGSNLLTISGAFAFAAGDVGSTVQNANVPVGTLLAAPTPVVGKTYQATMSNTATTTANGAALTLGRGAATVSGSNILTVAANMAGFTGFTAGDVGAFVTVGNVASGTTITAFIDPHHVQLSAAATATGSNLSFSLSTVTPSVLALGDTPLLGWFTRIEGHVFVDKNANGKMDPGEEGIPDFTMQLLNRTNQQYEQGQNVAGTDDSGAYSFNEGYPLGQYNVLQFFNTRFKTTGVTCQADNDPQEHTLITPAVDLSVNPIIGLNGRCDIGVQPYSTNPADNDNGGIVSTVTYQSYRTVLTNEQNVNNAYDVGIPDYNLDITQPVACTSATPADLCKNGFQLDPANSGQYLKHPYSDALLAANPDVNQTYLSEHFNVPPSCTPRMADGTVLDYNFQEAVQPGGACVESALFGTNFGFGTDNLPLQPNRTNPSDPCYEDPAYITPGGQYASRTIVDPSAPDFGKVRVAPALDAVNCVLHGVQTVDGNYGFATPGPGDYLVHVDMYTPAMVDMYGKPKYKVDTEANVNQYDGPMWVPQGGDYSGVAFGQAYNTGNPTPGQGLEENPNTQANAPHAQCAGPEYTVNNTNPAGPNYVSNPSFVAAEGGGGGPFEGAVRNRCDTILVHAQNGQSVAPNFFLYTDVPLATIFSGYATDDISVATNKKGTDLGEVQGIPNLPIGLYDWTGRQIDEVDSDPNGIWQFITPSTNTFNCSAPSGACPDVYRFVGNDPGQPAAPNLNYNPQYRTIAAAFQAWPNNDQPADVAPFKVAVSFEGNGSQFNTSVVCASKLQEPTFYTISRPYLNSTDFSNYRSFATATSSGTAGVTRSGISKFSSSTNAGSAVLNAAVVGSRITGTNIPANTTVLSKTAGKLAINASRTGGSNVLTTAANFFTASDVNSIYLGAGFGNGVVRISSVTDARHAVMSTNATSSNGNFGFALQPYVTLSNNETANGTGIAFTLTTPGGSTTNGSTTFTVAAAAAFTFTAGDVGSLLIAAGVPAGTTIASFTDAKHVTLSNAATATGSFLSFTVVSATASTMFTINGLGFGGSAGTLELDGVGTGVPAATALIPTTWSDTQITFAPPGTLLANPGQYQLVIRDSGGHQATGTVTFHVLGGSYNPTVLEVGPGKQFDPNGFRVDLTSGSSNAIVHGVLTLPAALETGVAEPNAVDDLDNPLPLVPVPVVGPGVPYGMVAVVGTPNANHTTPVTLYDIPPTVTQTTTVGPDGETLITTTTLTGGHLYSPPATQSLILQVGSPGDALVKGAVQRALEEAASHYVTTLNIDPDTGNFLGETVNQNDPVLIVVYPNVGPDGLSTSAFAPLSAYFENIIIHSPVRLQGVGPGGMYKDGGGVVHITPGANIDGRYFNAASTDTASILDNLPGAEPWAFDWFQLQAGLFYTNQNLPVEGEVVYVVGRPGMYGGPTAAFPHAITPTLDGLGVSGGDQKNFPGNLSEINGAKTTLTPPDETNYLEVQGGGITLHGDAANWRIGNNLIQWNSGGYGGAIRSGGPQLAADVAQVTADGGITTADSRDTNLDIHDNRIFANGGTNLAGAVGLFAGTNNYHIEHNAFCGNLAAEYGGAISQFGYSPNGEIDHNKIMLNQSIDEGGGIMIAGEVPLNVNTSTPSPNALSRGAGPESIHDNYIAANLAQDDGGGIRFLQAGNYPMNVFNNMITNNMSAHEGGGIAIDDAPNVRIYNDTIAKNITTATAVTSNGLPAPAGVSTTQNSAQLMACRTGQPNLTAACNGQPPQPSTAPSFSNPVLFNDVFSDNRAGRWDGVHSTVVGIGLPGDTSAHVVWNLGDADSALVALSPTHSVIGPAPDLSNITPDPSNVVADPQFVAPYDTILSLSPWRVQPRFRPASLVTETLPPDAIGDYHVNAASPVVALGAANKAATPFTPSPVVAPPRDIDSDLRTGHIDSGADQVVPGVNPNNGSGNVYTISGDAITPLGDQVLSDPTVSPVQFGTAGPANAAGNTALVLIPGRPLNTKTALVGGKLQLTPTLAAAPNSLVIEGMKPSTGPLVVEGAQMPGALHGVANVTVARTQARGAPPSAVIPRTHSSGSTLFTSAPGIATVASAGLLLLLMRMRRRRLATIASTETGGHDVLS